MADTVSPDDSTYQLATHTTVKNDETVPQDRINQQRILPNAISTRLLNSIFSYTDVGSASAVIPDGTSVTFNGVVEDKLSRPIIAFPDIAVYIGITDISQANDDNQWPTATVGGGSLPVYVNPSNWGKTNGTNEVSSVTVRNSTGTNQTILVVFQWRVLTQPGSASSQNSSAN